eukprot:2950301-Pleurochrysis_carterae.AAC.4
MASLASGTEVVRHLPTIPGQRRVNVVGEQKEVAGLRRPRVRARGGVCPHSPDSMGAAGMSQDVGGSRRLGTSLGSE